MQLNFKNQEINLIKRINKKNRFSVRLICKKLRKHVIKNCTYTFAEEPKNNKIKESRKKEYILFIILYSLIVSLIVATEVIKLENLKKIFTASISFILFAFNLLSPNNRFTVYGFIP